MKLGIKKRPTEQNCPSGTIQSLWCTAEEQKEVKGIQTLRQACPSPREGAKKGFDPKLNGVSKLPSVYQPRNPGA